MYRDLQLLLTSFAIRDVLHFWRICVTQQQLLPHNSGRRRVLYTINNKLKHNYRIFGLMRESQPQTLSVWRRRRHLLSWG